LIKLNEKNLTRLPAKVRRPGYNRHEVKTGIVHIGVGNFHRSHQAFFTDHLLGKGRKEWGICGISLLESDRRIYNTLVEQDGLYTLLTANFDGSFSAHVIGSIVEYIFAPENPSAVLQKMSDPDVKIITMTITEGGYNLDASTGEFQINESSIQWDIRNPDHPETVFGYLTQALKLRRDRGISGLTVQSCDNIQKNGDVLRKMLLSYVSAAEPGLTKWIVDNVSFPNSMVDRITPVTKPSDIETLKETFNIKDDWPVVCEPFIQWVVEDDYVNGRPDWENAGVQFVKDVGPYEKMKIRLLNAGHSLLGFTGTLYGLNTVDEAVNVPQIRKLLQRFMDEEVTPLLGIIEGIDLNNYKENLLRRFGNRNIRDKLSRICSESSAKIPKFLVPTILEQIAKEGPVKCGALIIATWCRYLELAGTPGFDYAIEDKLGSLLQERAYKSVHGDPLSFLKLETVFGRLAESQRFVATYCLVIESLRKYGINRTISGLDLLADG